MKYLKNIGKIVGIMTLILLILNLMITFFNYFNIMGKKTVTIAEIIIPVITLFVGGFLIGKRSLKKGWLEGLKLALIFLFIMILFNYLGLRNQLEMKNLIYYLILTITCMFGGMIGINKNKEIKKGM